MHLQHCVAVQEDLEEDGEGEDDGEAKEPDAKKVSWSCAQIYMDGVFG